ncbi:MAG: hypothetical protein MR922_07665 [Lachnospiraceae bacterium]|nr:hypothetical protein [Lachnospiraceae bacterium]
MKKRRYITCLLCIAISISGCGGYNESNIKKVSHLEQDIESDIRDEMPFQVSLDVQALQSGRENTVTAYILTDLSEWNYKVEVKNGKISNKTSNSFEYTCPVNETEDTITVWLTNSKNGKEYEYSIPLILVSHADDNKFSTDVN